MKNSTKGKLMLLSSMLLFGTIGLFRQWIPLSSGLLACLRGLIGGVFLLIPLALKRKKPDFSTIRRHLFVLLLSGAAMGINWVLLFEAYRHTTVATATLCYYFAPILILLAAPVFLKERLTLRKVLCVAAALGGMVLVSGVLESGFSGLTGILLGLGAACLYATVVLLNQKLRQLDSMEKTVVQLFASVPVTLLYAACSSEGLRFTGCDTTAFILIAVVGIVHTGLCYALYFGSARYLKAQTLALFSYIDPVVAVILSAAVLGERMESFGYVGAVLILGAAIVSELPERKKSNEGSAL